MTIKFKVALGYCLLDDEDEWALDIGTWVAEADRDRTFYIVAPRAPRAGRKQLHRLLLDAPAGTHVDHVNGHGWDNRRANLRLATHRQNSANRVANRGRDVPKGVCFNKKAGLWQAQIGHAGKRLYLGVFATVDAAASAYAEAARSLFGEFAAAGGGRPDLSAVLDAAREVPRKRWCRNGLHPWVPDNLVPHGDYLTCRMCKQASESRQRRPRSRAPEQVTS